MAISPLPPDSRAIVDRLKNRSIHIGDVSSQILKRFVSDEEIGDITLDVLNPFYEASPLYKSIQPLSPFIPRKSIEVCNHTIGSGFFPWPSKAQCPTESV